MACEFERLRPIPVATALRGRLDPLYVEVREPSSSVVSNSRMFFAGCDGRQVSNPVSDGLVVLIRCFWTMCLRGQLDVSVTASHQDEAPPVLRHPVLHQADRTKVHMVSTLFQPLQKTVERLAGAVEMLEPWYVLNENEIGSTRFNEVGEPKQERNPIIVA